MDDCPNYSCYNFAWQATLEGILSNLKGALQNVSNTNELGQEPAPKKLTTEAIFMLNVIFIFVILAVIGSSVSAIELFCKEFRKEIATLLLNGKEKNTNEAEYAVAKKKSFEPSFCASIKSKDVNIYNIKQLVRDGLHLAFKLISKNGVWRNCKKYLECFSIQSNLRKMLSTISGEEQFNALHGIKTLALIWVSISHICMFYATILKTVSEEFQNVLEMPIMQLIFNGIFANDVFFVLSGFLNAYMFFDYYEKRNGNIPWFLFYISRFLRFTPLYIIVLGSYATLFSYTGSGSVWPTYNTNPICRENWIWNVLYLNNFSLHKNLCMLTTWYIACDLQLYIVSPLFLLLLIRRPRTAFALIITCICGSCFTSFMLTKHFKLIDGISKLASHSHAMASFYGRFWVYFDMIYVKPYIRIGSYLVGIVLGYLVFQRKFSECKRNNLVTLSIGWLATILFSCIAFFALYNRDESDWERAIFNGVKDLLFSFSISWVIFVCVTGQGGIINWLLSLKIFVPFSRLSYCFYFIHMIAIEKYFLSVEQLTEFSLVSAVLLHFYIILGSWIVSFVVSLIFERPLLNLLGLFFKNTKQEKKTQ
ncbi:unnamed protein product [Larinioides sclopetarius]|uniref:Acyltransferase 3 domain-containing protein n=1 Tax=Larinioides sclopetarius TaxID=280406 RepID=A0AAV2AJN1_9ARAC